MTDQTQQKEILRQFLNNALHIDVVNSEINLNNGLHKLHNDVVISEINTDYIIIRNFLNEKFQSSRKFNSNVRCEMKNDMIPINQCFVDKKKKSKEEMNDKKRLQLTDLNPTEREVLQIDSIEAKLKEWFSTAINSDVKINEGIKNKSYNLTTSVLKSLKGCNQQSLHYDYDAKFYKRCFIGLLAVETATKLDILVKKLDENGNLKLVRQTIKIPKNGLFIARGDFIHGGSAYTVENVRLHFYIDDDSIEELVDVIGDDRETYYIAKEAEHIIIDPKKGEDNWGVEVKRRVEEAHERKFKSKKTKCSNLGIPTDGIQSSATKKKLKKHY